MTKTNTFTTVALDKLVDESIAEADKLEAELKDIDETQLAVSEDIDDVETDDYLNDSSKTFSEIGDVIDKDSGSSISFNYVYKKIGDLIDQGTASLQMLQSIDLDVADPTLLGQTATLMNSIKGCISEFTKIHQQWIKFNQTVKLENMRFENRKKLIKYRNDVLNGTDEKKTSSTDMIDVKTSDLIEFLQWKKAKEEQEKKKEENI